MNNEPTSATRSSEGKSVEWLSWLKENTNQLRLYAELQCRNWSDAEDVLQKATVQLSRAVVRGSVAEGQEQWRAYIYKAIRHLAIDTGRHRENEIKYARKQQETLREGVEETPWLTCDADAEYMRNRVQSLIRILDPKFAEVIVLHYFNELTFQEIADVTEEKLSTITSRNRYALKKMHEELQKFPIER